MQHKASLLNLYPKPLDTMRVEIDTLTVKSSLNKYARLEADPRQAEIHRERRRAAVAGGTAETVAMVAALAREIRLTDLGMIERAGLGHIGGDFSVADILATLYGAVLAVDPSRPDHPERDRPVLIHDLDTLDRPYESYQPAESPADRAARQVGWHRAVACARGHPVGQHSGPGKGEQNSEDASYITGQTINATVKCS